MNPPDAVFLQAVLGDAGVGDGMLGVGNLGADQIETDQMMGTKWRAVGDTVYPFTLPASGEGEGEGERIRRRERVVASAHGGPHRRGAANQRQPHQFQLCQRKRRPGPP